MKQAYVLHYWGIKARGYLPALVAKVGGFPLEWDRTPDWPAIKPRSPTGQLPFMEGPNGFRIGQSLAIVRFIARKTGLDGATDEEFAMSEQLIQQAEDLYTCLAKAHYGGGGARRTEEMDALFGQVLPPLLDVLARLMQREARGSESLTTQSSSSTASESRGRERVKIDDNYNNSKQKDRSFAAVESLQDCEDGHTHTFTGRVLAGDLAVYVALDLLVTLQSDCLSNHPTILDFYLGLNRIEKIREVGSPLQPYFRRYTDSRAGDASPTLRPITSPFVFNSASGFSASSARPLRSATTPTPHARESSASPTRKLEADSLAPHNKMPALRSSNQQRLLIDTAHATPTSSSHQVSPTASRSSPAIGGDDLQYHSPSSHHNNSSGSNKETVQLLKSSTERERERHRRSHHSATHSNSRSNSRARDHGEHEPSEDSPRLKERAEKIDLNVHVSSTVTPDRLRRSSNQRQSDPMANAVDALSHSSKSMELIVLDASKPQATVPSLAVVRPKSTSGGKEKEKDLKK